MTENDPTIDMLLEMGLRYLPRPIKRSSRHLDLQQLADEEAAMKETEDERKEEEREPKHD